jgi:hypothetical protein
MMRQATLPALVLFVLAGCDTRDDTEVGTLPAMEATQPPATTIGDVPANDPDTIGWIQRGELLEWGGREWMLVAEPVTNPILRHVGEADGLALYAMPDRDPALQLFFHLGNDRWQMLEPVGEGLGRDAAVPADTT